MDIESEGQLDHMIAEKRADAYKRVAICAHGLHGAEHRREISRDWPRQK